MKGYATRNNRNSGKAKRKAEHIKAKQNARFSAINREIINCKQMIALLKDNPDGICYFDNIPVRRGLVKCMYEETLKNLEKELK